MLNVRKSFYLNKSGQQSQSITELYKRKDIPCGFNCCIFNSNIQLPPNTIFFIPSYDILINNKSLIFSPHSILLQSVLEKIKSNNHHLYYTFLKIIEKEQLFIFYDDHYIFKQPNQDTSIQAHTFYTEHKKEHTFFYLNEQNIHTFLNNPLLFNYINTPIIKGYTYQEYTNEGLSGTFFSSHYNYFSGYIKYFNEQENVYEKYYVNNKDCVNRALHGDKVYFRITEEVEEEMDIIEGDQSDHIKNINTNTDTNPYTINTDTDTNTDTYTNNPTNTNPTNTNPTNTNPTNTNPTNTNPTNTNPTNTNPANLKYASITGILKRKESILIGSIISQSHNTLLIKPIERKYPPVQIQVINPNELINQRVQIMIKEWNKESKYPSGNYIRCIGPAGDFNVELKCIFLNNDIIEENNECVKDLFEEKIRTVEHEKVNYLEVIGLHGEEIKRIEKEKKSISKCNCNCIDTISTNPTNTNPISTNTLNPIDSNTTTNPTLISINSNRIDLTHLPTFSIDPPGCTDIDDCLSVIKIKEDKNTLIYQVGVHIADVSSFVPINSDIDKQAFKRSTSVYLNHKRIDMLPEILSSNLCSLQENKIRLSMSVLINIEVNTCSVLSYTVSESFIKSNKSFTYEEAYKTMLNKESVYFSDLNILYTISKKLKERRIQSGAFTLNEKESKEEEYFITCSLIEEFMVLCNCLIAEYSFKRINNCLLRMHPLSETNEIKSKSEEVNRMLMIRSMSQAVYIEGEKKEDQIVNKEEDKKDTYTSKEDIDINMNISQKDIHIVNNSIFKSSLNHYNTPFKHHGLAVPLYTHFTSPIRRYSDLTVHRIIKSILFKNDYLLNNKEVLKKIIKKLNNKKRHSQIVTRECNTLYNTMHLKKNLKGIVFKKMQGCVLVYLPEYDMDGVVWEEIGLDEEIEVDIKGDYNGVVLERSKK